MLQAEVQVHPAAPACCGPVPLSGAVVGLWHWHWLQGVIKLGDKRGESKCTLVYGQMNEPPGARARVALTGEARNAATG